MRVKGSLRLPHSGSLCGRGSVRSPGWKSGCCHDKAMPRSRGTCKESVTLSEGRGECLGKPRKLSKKNNTENSDAGKRNSWASSVQCRVTLRSSYWRGRSSPRQGQRSTRRFCQLMMQIISGEKDKPKGYGLLPHWARNQVCV